MDLGAVIEPLVVLTLLFGGTYLNRNRDYRLSFRRESWTPSLESGYSSPVATDGLLDDGDSSSISSATLLPPPEPQRRKRDLRFFGWQKEVTTPNTRVFKDRFLSRLLRKFPFLVEAWYWALIYWVYQLGRAATAVLLVEGTVHTARRHALQLIRLEERLHIFHELAIQKWFLGHPTLMTWINRIYSFIHIPGTILFLVWLYYYTTPPRHTTLHRSHRRKGLASPTPSPRPASPTSQTHTPNHAAAAVATPALYEARRRTMATCNLVAFIVFTLWPCMPPRLLSDPNVNGPSGEVARRFGFVDTVHGAGGEGSVWTQNRFCNQYAAMPSLHFGYSLLIGVTVAGIPTGEERRRGRERGRMRVVRLLGARVRVRMSVPGWRRVLCVAIGFLYPFTILVAIVATANHFILDAVAGAAVCAVAWKGNGVLLNLLPVEDWFLWCLRIHKPERGEGCEMEGARSWD